MNEVKEIIILSFQFENTSKETCKNYVNCFDNFGINFILRVIDFNLNKQNKTKNKIYSTLIVKKQLTNFSSKSNLLKLKVLRTFK